ncbi:hypothetical protein CHS0354_022559 [Potamilus streckersoni]|uniref:Apextrin C-terminal domain-containing protein n=1 Tax=Potamilus streckersoni TaxID=2493646 RepID=A0AAE0WAG3_9BIVA|nr:hypothetical protein CHS0354_022559 [Potamilus streckersoni]
MWYLALLLAVAIHSVEAEASTDKPKNEIMQWPDGDYATLKPSSGCPADVTEKWQEGYRKEYGKGTYNYSIPLDLFGEFTEEYMKFFFCVHKSVKDKSLIPKYQTYWEPGRYCILQSGGKCPTGFKSGYAQMDDADDKVHLFENGGTLPDGYFVNDTGLYFCCRDDGLVTKEIVLPNRNPFILYMMTGETKCQTVRGMTSSIQYLQFNDDHNGNRGIANGTLPAIKIENNTTILFLCHYKPVECGCLVESKCKTKGEEWSVLRSEGCVRHVCQMQMVNNTEKFIVKEIGQDCTWMDSCKAVNSTWKHGCITYRCDLSVGKDHYKLTVEPTEFGCSDGDKCYNVGEKVARNCYEVVCKLSENKTTVYFNIVQEGCKDSKNNCIAVGEQKTEGCITYKCVHHSVNIGLQVLAAGCDWRGVCKPENSTWTDDENCVDYRCKKVTLGGGTFVRTETIAYGCKWNGTCKPADATWSEDCLRRKCIVVVNATHVQRQVMSTVEGCQTTGSSECHAVDSTWTEIQNNSCTRLTCTRNGQALTTKVLDRLCLDSIRTCHPVGDSGFQTEIQGLVRTNCSCLARDMEAGVMVQCSG